VYKTDHFPWISVFCYLLNVPIEYDKKYGEKIDRLVYKSSREDKGMYEDYTENKT
jgi:hypothetical protein